MQTLFGLLEHAILLQAWVKSSFLSGAKDVGPRTLLHGKETPNKMGSSLVSSTEATLESMWARWESTSATSPYTAYLTLAKLENIWVM